MDKVNIGVPDGAEEVLIIETEEEWGKGVINRKGTIHMSEKTEEKWGKGTTHMSEKTEEKWGKGVIGRNGTTYMIGRNGTTYMSGEETPKYRRSYLSEINPEHVTTSKIPEALGECADMLMNIKNDRSKIKKQDDELKNYATILKDYVLTCLEEQGLTSSSGNAGCVTIGTTNRYSVGDKEAFLAHIIESEGYDLIGSSVNAAAMGARVTEGEEVPGVKCFEQTQIKLTKRKG